jgi:hypothetical protein
MDVVRESFVEATAGGAASEVKLHLNHYAVSKDEGDKIIFMPSWGLIIANGIYSGGGIK